MSKTHAVILTHAASEAGVRLNEVHDAALATAASVETTNIWSRAFRVRSRQFALSTRLTIEVDSFPQRAPQGALSAPHRVTGPLR